MKEEEKEEEEGVVKEEESGFQNIVSEYLVHSVSHIEYKSGAAIVGSMLDFSLNFGQNCAKI